MALDEKRRQKKLAKKSAKRKAQHADKRLKASTVSGHSPAQAAHCPIYECLMPKEAMQSEYSTGWKPVASYSHWKWAVPAKASLKPPA
jgi:hypothetical protein